MKKLFGLLSACFILLAIISCSNLNESSSLLLTFKGSDFARNSSARNILVNPDDTGYYIVASVLGDYRETKSLQITGNGTYTLEFNSIPAGSKIYVEANVYNPNAVTEAGANSIEPLHIFTGTSGKQTVYPGKNQINLSMTNLSKDIAYSNNGTITKSNTSTITEEGSFIDNLNAAMIFFPNGKYQIVNYNYTTPIPTVDIVISEGIWSGSFEESGIIYITECIYKNYTFETVDGKVNTINFNDNVIVENPVTKGFEYNLNSDDASGNRIEEFTINLLNGLKVTHQTS